VSAKEEGIGAGVLIRALEPLEGLDQMKLNRVEANPSVKMTNLNVQNTCAGPARLSHALQLREKNWMVLI